MKTIKISNLNHAYLLEALRAMARKKCIKHNCGTVCLCPPCSARKVLQEIE